MLECSKAEDGCLNGEAYADILEFRTIALANGIPAHQDLVRLIVTDHMGMRLRRTTFTIIENDRSIPFGIRPENGKGVVYTLKPLEEKRSYRIKVKATSFDHRQRDIRYRTTFILFISVSAFPY